jgi:phage replication O-like protein O
MSTPQLEDGHVRIANDLLEAILGFGFSQRELLVLLTIIRKTYGFNKKEDDMSASQIGEICSLARPHVTAVLNQLAARNVINKRQGHFGTIVGIQKDSRKWVSAGQLKGCSSSTDLVHVDSTDSVQGSTQLVQGCTESVHVPNQYSGSTDSVQVGSTESVHTKDNLPKDNQQKTNSCAPTPSAEKLSSHKDASAKAANQPMRRQSDALQARFEKFYEAYPKKRARRDAENAFAKLQPDDAMLDLMLAAIARFQGSGEWANPQFIPHPASWLNSGRWTDEVQTAYTANEVEVIEAFNAALGEQMGAVSLTPYVADRAAAIRDFRTFSAKPGFVQRFFPWVRENANFPPNAGFDWVISRKGYANLTSGQHSRKAA